MSNSKSSIVTPLLRKILISLSFRQKTWEKLAINSAKMPKTTLLILIALRSSWNRKIHKIDDTWTSQMGHASRRLYTRLRNNTWSVYITCVFFIFRHVDRFYISIVWVCKIMTHTRVPRVFKNSCNFFGKQLLTIV